MEEAVTHSFDWYTFIRDSVLIVATLSAAIWGCLSYTRQKREERATTIRGQLITYVNNCKTLNQLITYDVVHEIVSCVVYSPIINRQLSILNYSLSMVSDDEVSDFAWPWPITIPLHSRLIDDYEYILRRNQEICTMLGAQLPSLNKVFLCVHNIFWGILDHTKNFVRDEKILGKMYLDVKSTCADNIELQKDEIFYRMSGAILSGYQQEQKNIDDALRLLNLVYNSVLKLQPKELESQRKREQKMTWGEYGSKSSLFEEFQETEKAFEKIMTPEEILKFRELYTRIQVRIED